MGWILIIFELLSSIIFVLSSNKIPQLQELFVPKNLVENQTIRLLCATVQDELTDQEKINFNWYFNDEKIKENLKKKVKLTDDSSELIIKSLSIDDLGEIKCVASNKYGKAIQKVQISINAKPRFIKDPKDVTDRLFKEINLQCQVKAYPPPITKWFRLSDNKKSIIKEFETNSLKFELSKDTAGLYKCSSSNPMGQIEKLISVGYYGE